MTPIVFALVLAVASAGAPAPAPASLDLAHIEKLTGLKGSVDEKTGVVTVSSPRSDLHVTVAGVKMVPFEGLGSWAAFDPMGEHTMVMGDLCLTADQVNVVMSAALDNGLEVTALHNHFLWDEPRIMFMHVGGTGDADALATAIGKVFQTLKATENGHGAVPTYRFDMTKSRITPKPIDEVLAHPGKLDHGVYKLVWGRNTTMNGMPVGQAMGVTTWAAFGGTDERALVDGDFSMKVSELQPVLKVLRHGGINVVAIHNHMVDEEPRLVFLHYWGIGSAKKLAETLKSALAETKAD